MVIDFSGAVDGSHANHDGTGRPGPLIFQGSNTTSFTFETKAIHQAFLKLESQQRCAIHHGDSGRFCL